jgi:hypothetical protein
MDLPISRIKPFDEMSDEMRDRPRFLLSSVARGERRHAGLLAVGLSWFQGFGVAERNVVAIDS